MFDLFFLFLFLLGFGGWGSGLGTSLVSGWGRSSSQEVTDVLTFKGLGEDLSPESIDLISTGSDEFLQLG